MVKVEYDNWGCTHVVILARPPWRFNTKAAYPPQVEEGRVVLNLFSEKKLIESLAAERSHFRQNSRLFCGLTLKHVFMFVSLRYSSYLFEARF